MKQFKLATLAAAGLLASGLAGAGTLQVTPIQYAAETIVSGTALTAPVFSYALAAPISVSSSPIFDFDFELNNAVWDKVTAHMVPSANPGTMFYIVSQDGTTSLKATALSYSNGDKTLRLRFTMVAGGAVGLVGATPAANYTFPVGSNIVIGSTVAPPSVIGTAAMVVPANSCSPTDVDTKLKTYMYDALGSLTSETAVGGAINFVQENTYLRSSSGLSVTATAPAATIESSKIDVTQPSLGRFFTNDADAAGTANNTNTVAIARVRFSDRGTFKDATVGAVGNYTVATGFTGAGGAAAGPLGNVSVDKMNLRVTGAFNTNGTVYMSSLPTCLDEIDLAAGTVAALATGTAASAGARATLVAGSATFTGLKINVLGFTGAAPTAYVCYKRDISVASSVLPPSQFRLDATVANVTHVAESGSPVCGDALYNLRQNGVQVDLRNVVAKTSPAYAEGWRSFIRVINTDEAQTATVAGQVIKSDGTVMGGSTLVTLAPRAYKFMDTDQIETALFGSTSAGYAANDGSNYRLRLSSPTSSIRVQNYLFNPTSKNFIEASSSQGDEQPGILPVVPTVQEDARK